MIDCTSSEEVTEYYERWLRAGISVIGPNKQLGSGPIERYRRVASASRERDLAATRDAHEAMLINEFAEDFKHSGEAQLYGINGSICAPSLPCVLFSSACARDQAEAIRARALAPSRLSISVSAIQAWGSALAPWSRFEVGVRASFLTLRNGS